MKRISFLILNFSFLILFVGCGVFKNYERPDDIVVEGIYGAEQNGDSLGLGDLSWREVFTDPQLQGLIQQGLDNNPDLLNAALNVKMMETALTVAKLAFLPSVTLSPQGTLSSFDGAPATKA